MTAEVSVGDGPVTAGRQAAALFALGSFCALIGLPLPGARPGYLAAVAALDLFFAVVAAAVPWHRLGRSSTVALAVPAFAVLALSTYAFGGQVVGTGPFFVLTYAWLGLHHPRPFVPAVAPVATAAYLVPLIVTRQPQQVLGSAFVLVPVSIAVGWVIATRVGRLRAAHEHIRATETWRAALMSTLAHDVRSPLASVQMALEILEQDGDRLTTEERHLMAGAALRQTARIKRLASDLLDLDRVEAGTLRLDCCDVPLRAAVESAVGDLNTTDVTVAIDADLVVRADPERLQQIVVNLVSNALRHGKPPVLVGAEPDGAAVAIRVRDHGPGVPEDQVAALFQRYTGTHRDSVGLGLWIVAQLARAHGGTVRYEQEACFVVTLPRAATSSVTLPTAAT
jgi:signal transduction histidine kinase